MGLPIVDGAPEGRSGGRRSSYALRVSVLEQCQLDCRYCRPGAVVSPVQRARWLSAAEHARLAPLFLAAGVRKVRFTGGEPTLRPDLPDVVAAWTAAGAGAVALTTNGLRLPPLLPALVHAGLRAVTVHLDTLQPARVAAVMGPGADVFGALAAMDAAQAAGLSVKWNCVVQRGVNDDELHAMLAAAADRGVELRFIEQMNTGSAAGYVRETFLSGADIVAGVAARARVRALPRRHGSDPAALWATGRPVRHAPAATTTSAPSRTATTTTTTTTADHGDDVVFGVIASDTEPFCDACDRLRLSADGRVRGCLYEPGGLPLGAALRGGADDDALAALLAAALQGKRSHHPLARVERAPFSMADVGG
jgi:cyclic pyranopterin phosphate synthase